MLIKISKYIKGRALTALPFVLMIIIALSITGCKGPKMSVADEQLARGEFFEASKTYRKLYSKLTKREERPLRGEVAYKMATCYRRMNQAARASAAYQNAIRYEYPDSMSYFWLGKSLQAEGKYAPAIQAYETFMEWRPNDIQARSGILGCRMALEAKEKKVKSRYVVKNAQLFNSRRSDFAPMFLDKTYDQLYFTSSNEKVTGDGRSEITGMKKNDIWRAKKNERGEWERPEPVEGELNTVDDEGIVSFSPDGQTMYFTKARRSPVADTSVEIYTSRRSDASWSAPQKYEISRDTLSAFGHPAVSPDGKYLYFSSDMPGGYGGKDIWRVNLLDKVGSLENLGPQINTPGDEVFPYMRTDSLLYFSSDGHQGYGGLDLFRAWRDASGERWSVENLGQPMNSPGDDFGITFGPGESGFFSSNRGDGRGYDHIYSFELPDLKVTISGWVLDKEEEPVPGAIIRIVGNDGSNQKEVAKDDGSFKFNLSRGVRYVMLAGADGYLNQKQEFESDAAEEDAEYGIDFILSAINRPQVIDNIFYDFDRATLRPESKEALDWMVGVMKDNPHITVELSSHTDRWGADSYNIPLSERRAKAVVDYLVTAGIPRARLTAKGYGKSQPKTISKRLHNLFPQFPEGAILSEEYILTLPEEDQGLADQINRRTEFFVTSTDYEF